MSEYIVRMPSDMPYEIKAELNAWYVNSEPIVRCRDCEGKDDCEAYQDYKNPDGFCAWGERKVVTEC